MMYNLKGSDMVKQDVGVGYYRVNNLRNVSTEELTPLYRDQNGAMVYKHGEDFLIFCFSDDEQRDKSYICEIEINNAVVNLLIPEKKACFNILVLDDDQITITNVIAVLNAEYLHRLQLINMNLPIYLEFSMYAGMKCFPHH